MLLPLELASAVLLARLIHPSTYSRILSIFKLGLIRPADWKTKKRLSHSVLEHDKRSNKNPPVDGAMT